VTVKKRKKSKSNNEEISRRDFLKLSGTAAVGLSAGVIFSDVIWLDEAIAAIPASEGYLLVDTKKCQGCLSCMLACSLVHEGVENLSLARIQVVQDSFRGWPDDLTIEQCRQCVAPACVEACPTGALYADAKSGNVRTIDAKKCTGCQACLKACPYQPGGTGWNPDEKHAQKCDLCADAPYHWDKAGGGPKGKQACVEVCPLGAIKFTKKIPEQKGDKGYKVNLRGDAWRKLGYPTTD
jgi:protein NrfC